MDETLFYFDERKKHDKYFSMSQKVEFFFNKFICRFEYIYNFILMQEEKNHLISTNKYNLQITYFPVKKSIELLFVSKISNHPFSLYLAKISDVEEKKFWGQIRKYRKLLLNPMTPSITLPGQNSQTKLLRQNSSDTETINEKILYQKNNYKVKYIMAISGKMEIDIAFNTYASLIFIATHDKAKQQVKIAQTTVSLSLLQGKSPFFREQLPEDERIPAFFQSLSKSTVYIDWNSASLRVDNQLISPIKLNSPIIIQKQQISCCEKVTLFRHIFLTELVAQMISNKFGRQKSKLKQYRNGHVQWEYEDEELEELRSFGLRFSDFRDHPFQRKKIQNPCPKKKEDKKRENQQIEESQDDYEDDDQNDQDQDYLGIPEIDSSDEEEKNQKEEGSELVKIGKKKTKLGRIKEKMQMIEGICNFTFISGREKSNINSIRYCLYQMTQETDKTQALMDFIRLIFKLYPKQNLVTKERETNKKEKIAYFLKKFRTRLQIGSCLEEYTRESFFHRILNIGLRVLKQPFELVYLRIPFSHLFWSIKRLYHRQKRVIFHLQKQERKKMFIFYRGFRIDQKEVKKIRKSIDGYIEIEGFLSTTLSEPLADCFVTNAKMVIEVKVANLGGMHDNGFANISGLSVHPNEKEVLVNAFNIFKILSIYSTVKNDEMIIHTVRLEYGSLKPLQKKVQKSQNLLDAEFFFHENRKELIKASKALKINKDKMTTAGYEKLIEYLPQAQKQLKKRVKELNQWTRNEYISALQKLNQWEKELIQNSNHQQDKLKDINNYGDLLLCLGQFRKAIVYCSRRVKQVELDRAVEGYRWRNCQILINKEQVHRRILYISYLFINKPKDCFLQCQKLLNVYNSTNMRKSDLKYYQLLYYLYFSCEEIDKVKQSQHFKEKLLKTIQQNQSEDKVLDYYRGMMNISKINERSDEKKSPNQNVSKQEQKDEQKQKQKRREKIKQRKAAIRTIKQKLEEIKLFSFGQYSSEYLSQLWSLIYLLVEWKYWRMVIDEGMQYLQIRKQTPYLVPRQKGCEVFAFILHACKEVNCRQSFYYTCGEVASFIPLTIQNNKELPLVGLCIEICLRKEWWRAIRPIITKLVRCTVRCALPAQHINDLMLFGYALLLLSGTQQTIVRKFLSWIQKLFQQESCQQTLLCTKILDSVIMINDPDLLTQQRDKDFFNSRYIQYFSNILTIKTAQFSIFNWQDRIAPLIPFQHPLHSFQKNMGFLKMGIENQLMQRQELVMIVEYLKQMRNTKCNFFMPHQTEFYLRHAYIFSRLHLNDWSLQGIPSWFHFYPLEKEALALLQMEEMSIDFEECAENVQLKEELKKNNRLQVRKRIESIAWRRSQIRQMGIDDFLVKKARKMYARYKHFLRSTSLRRLRLIPRKKNRN